MSEQRCWRFFTGTDGLSHYCDLERHPSGKCHCILHKIDSVTPIPKQTGVPVQ